MNRPESINSEGIGRYRIKLMAVMMVMVTAVTGAGLYLAERTLTESVNNGFEREFVAEIDTLYSFEELRHANFFEVCQKLARKPRLHAALEDNALDLLYPIAKDELRELMISPSSRSVSRFAAEFYRFLDQKGRVISPLDSSDAGSLRPEEENQLSLPELPQGSQTGYLVRGPNPAGGLTLASEASSSTSLSAVIVTPIISTETMSPIGALAIGFKPATFLSYYTRGIRNGFWIQDELYMSELPAGSRSELKRLVAASLVKQGSENRSTEISINGESYLLFHRQLNPGSHFARAHEISLYPLKEFLSRKRKLRWSFAVGGGIVLLVGLLASKILSVRFSTPVERLASESEDSRVEHAHTEALLKLTHEGLQRAVRFSADASHQLKTPVTVMRSGLEEILSRTSLDPEVRDELDCLVHQTLRLTSIVDDLLLLSQVDAGRVQLKRGPVDFSRLLETAVDDLGIVDDSEDLSIEAEIPPDLVVDGESRYISIILQNLIENARKYNQRGGTIRIGARTEDARVRVWIGNTGQTIPAEMQEHIFERFHRGSVGENVPGHGLGLNLARELARIHGGDLRLIRSDSNWTEFEAYFDRFIVSLSPEVPA